MNVIGIDFGTTKTIAAHYLKGAVCDERGNRSMPSLVLVTPNQELFVGWEARLHPQRYESDHITINSIKRSLGREGGHEWASTRTQEIAALILSQIKLTAERSFYSAYRSSDQG